MKAFIYAVLISALIIAATFAVAPPAKAGPSMSSGVAVIGTIDQETCLARGANATKALGFTTGLEIVSNNSVYGEMNAYTLHIRCFADMGVVFFIVAGPSGEVTSKVLTAVKERF